MSDRPPTMLIFADADPTIGIGHVARCAVLANAWREAGGRAIGMGNLPKSLLNSNFGARLFGDNFEWQATDTPGIDIQSLPSLQETYAADWVVLDGYHYSDAMVATVREIFPRLMILDDSFRLTDHRPDVLLIPSPDAAESYYPLDESTLGLLGPRFRPIASEFHTERTTNDQRATNRIAVLTGGSDPARLSETLLDAIEQLDEEIETILCIGPANPRLEALTERAERINDASNSTRVQIEFDPAQPAQILRDVDLAISAAGGSCWELAAMGVPSLLVTTAGNQRPAAQWLEQHGLACYLGDLCDLKPEQIAETIRVRLRESTDEAQATSKLIDCRGTDQTIAILRELTDRTAMDAGRYQIRPVRVDDAPALWRLANAPSIRNWSTHRDTITPANHRRWFFGRIEDPANCRIWMLDLADLPIGSIRYQRRDKQVGPEAIISFQVAAPLRGRGLGTSLMRSTLAQAVETLQVERLTAFVYRDNTASARCFEKLGFRHTGPRCTRQKICFELPAEDALENIGTIAMD